MKFILIGNSGVGKSAMLFQFIEDRFRNDLEPTIGIEFGTKLVNIQGESIRLQIWDSAGQENYRSITRSYYRNTICALLMYDIANRKSFNDLKSWLKEAKTHGNTNTHYVLLANKCDIEDKRVISTQEGIRFAHNNNLAFYEVSAKENINVTKAFEEACEKILGDIKKGTIDPSDESIGVKVGVVNSGSLVITEEKMNKKIKRRKCC